MSLLFLKDYLINKIESIEKCYINNRNINNLSFYYFIMLNLLDSSFDNNIKMKSIQNMLKLQYDILFSKFAFYFYDYKVNCKCVQYVSKL